MGFGRVLALVGVAAAGVAWFKRRGREHIEGDRSMSTSAAPASPDSMDDPVDEAIAESFPASDPPSFAGSPRNGEIT